MIEFAVTAPILIMIAFGAVDFGRLLYAYAAMSSAAREGARIASLSTEISTDCNALLRMESVGQGFPLSIDPNSLAGDHDPNGTLTPGPTTPPPGQGYIYLYPAVATIAPQDQAANCGNGLPRQFDASAKHIAVEIQYNFKPLTPVVSYFTSGFVIKTIAVVQVEY